MGRLDPIRLARGVRAIPAGCWMSYGDVARASGGEDRHARTLNQYFIRHRIAGAHRVLMADGTISRSALGDPTAVRRLLEAEAVVFVRDRASQDVRMRPPGASRAS
jgi:alkylated DNA nucleotide flippase Atl1